MVSGRKAQLHQEKQIAKNHNIVLYESNHGKTYIK